MEAAFDGFLRYLHLERNASELTRKAYAEDFASFLDYCTDRHGHVPDPEAADMTLLRGYLTYLHDCGYQRTTIARRLACLRSLFRYCQREQLCTSNPAKALRTPRVGRKLPHYLTTREIGTLLEAPPANEPQGLRDRAILETLYTAGLRVAELVSLNLEDWDQDANILRVRGKGKKERPSRKLCPEGVITLAGGAGSESSREIERTHRAVSESIRPAPDHPQHWTAAGEIPARNGTVLENQPPHVEA